MSKYISKYAPHQTVKIPNLEQYVAIFHKGTGTGPVSKRVRKIPVLNCNIYQLEKIFEAIVAENPVFLGLFRQTFRDP